MRKLKIGFAGGGIMSDLGTDSDMQLFFECISYYVPSKYPDQNWSIITDGLYRRYLKLEELDDAESLMKIVEKEFKQLNREAVDWSNVESGEAQSDLDRSKPTLFEIFFNYFESFYQCVEFVKYFDDKYGNERVYRPIMVAITTIPYETAYGQIPLSVFDNLKPDDKPIWWTGKIPKTTA